MAILSDERISLRCSRLWRGLDLSSVAGFAKYLYKRDTFKYHAFFMRISMTKELHIGQTIQEKLREKERTVAWFARKLCCIRSNVYKIFKKQSIDTALLLRISIILEEDLFSLYSDTLNEKQE